MELKKTSYAGMLDQNGFRQWYKYLKFRTIHRYETEEVSFLMSKPPFYFRDYELLAAGAKITCEDQVVLAEVFRGQWIEQLDFCKDDFGTLEKRIVRVRQEESPGEIGYLITLPWTIKGKDKASELRLIEKKRAVVTEEEKKIRGDIGITVDRLMVCGFFRSGRLALEVYHEVEERCRWSPQLRPRYVKEVLYQQISTRNLTLKMRQGRLHYQEWG